MLIKFLPSIIEVLTKNERLHKTHENLVSFYDGFCRDISARRDQLRMGHLKRWLDAIMFQSLNELSKAYAEDALSLVKIIIEHGDDEFRQL